MSDRALRTLPELLCPVGSPEALDAAIEGGADAVYLGGSLFNARMNAKNFNSDALSAAVLHAHTHGVKVYQTINTLCFDREKEDFLRTAKEAYLAGVDALIVADLGGAALIHEAIPDMELHASTQMSGHSADMGAELKKRGFSRMVIARETSARNIETITEKSPIEVEIFVHGALCVSHSGQCLFSSLVGGRSGNRGECAQPCRLPYSCANGSKKNAYPLSLKDLSLAAHVPELIRMGVASLKIEGRMKSPEYVYETARIWRRLLDERRAATKAEMQALADAFSRGGFTDGYFTGRIDRSMLGIRSEGDKAISRSITPFAGLTKKATLTANASILRDRPSEMTLSDGIHTVTVMGDVPMEARTAPLTKETVERNLTKTGGTDYAIDTLNLSLDDSLMLPVSRLNDLRRRALSALADANQTVRSERDFQSVIKKTPKTAPVEQFVAHFSNPAQITEKAKRFFDHIALPLHRYTDAADRVILPPVIFDSDREKIQEMMDSAVKSGARGIVLGNLGHIDMARAYHLPLIGDHRLNVANDRTARELEDVGLCEFTLSPELTLPQMRDVRGNTAVIVYGRIPLMTLEKCLSREVADCKICGAAGVTVTDRRGIVFPILREWEHHNVLYNSLSTSMSDRSDELARFGIVNRQFLFTTETPNEVDEIIHAFQNGLPLPQRVRRIAK